MTLKSRQDRAGGAFPGEAGESGRGIENGPENANSPGEIIAAIVVALFVFILVFSTCVDCADRISMAEDRWQSKTERGTK